MAHPFFDATSFPWARPEARALYAVLTEVVTDPREIRTIYAMSGGRPADLDITQATASIWTDALTLLATGGLLSDFCTQLEAVDRLQRNKAFQTAVRDVVNAEPAAELQVSLKASREDKAVILLEVVAGDILAFDASVVAFKYAQSFHGADWAAAESLEKHGVPRGQLESAEGGAVLVPTEGALAAPFALFVGVPALSRFRYSDIHDLASTVLRTLAQRMPAAEHLAMTIHGPGIGLDEVEAFLSQVTGYVDAFLAGDAPPGLRRISIVDRRPERVKEIKKAFKTHYDEFPGATAAPNGAMTIGVYQSQRSGRAGSPDPRSLDRASDAKPHLFVALPFDSAMDDLYRYGIQGPANAAGFLCERLGADDFNGDVLERIRDRIPTSSAVIGVLTGDNPKVFLEVGYSWGVGRPTILVSKDEHPSPIEVRGQMHIRYRNITDLEEKLAKEFIELRRTSS